MDGEVRIGDFVEWRGHFGIAEPQRVRVEELEVTERPRTKYGESVESASWELVRANRVLFTLSTGNWAYGEQVMPVDGL